MTWKRAFGTLIMLCALIFSADAQSPPQPQKYFFYQLVFLVRPPSRPELPQDAAEKLQQAHLANIGRLAKEGKLVMAGPFLDDTDLRGIFVLKTNSLDEAKQWTETDPVVQAKRLVPEYHTWIQPTSTFHTPPESNPMENYAAVVYKKGAKFRSLADPKMRGVIGQHMAFLRDQEDRKMAVGGPFKDGTGETLGMLIFAATPAEAEQIVAEDPFVKSGEVKPEVHPWMTMKGVLEK